MFLAVLRGNIVLGCLSCRTGKEDIYGVKILYGIVCSSPRKVIHIMMGDKIEKRGRRLHREAITRSKCVGLLQLILFVQKEGEWWWRLIYIYIFFERKEDETSA